VVGFWVVGCRSVVVVGSRKPIVGRSSLVLPTPNSQSPTPSRVDFFEIRPRHKVFEVEDYFPRA
jgi:hypothetical protein